MKKNLLFVTALALVISSDILQSQPTVVGGTGQLSFALSSYGRFRVSAKVPFVSADREVDRMTFNAAVSKDSLYDYTEDSDTSNYVAQLITVPGVDTAAECICDNDYSGKPPKVRIRHTVYAWNNTKYLIIRFKTYSDESKTLPYYLGAVVIPKVGQSYGGESLRYDQQKKTAYYYRAGTDSYWGFKLLGTLPYSVKLYDWDYYSADPNTDASTDSIRFIMTATTGIDTALEAGSNGAILNVNAGKFTIAPKDSASVYYAVAYGTNVDSMLAQMTLAATKYKAVFTSVEQGGSIVPRSITLEQNYPNPFNPSTEIRFGLPQRDQVKLTMYDALGREVLTLLNMELDAGTYSKTLQADRLSSGVYYYTLRTGAQQLTRRMVILK